ncbi:glutamine--fructose-6-phosphate transaminase (isomerizing) [Chloroflexota bacterium]
MCGIVGYIGARAAQPILINSLKRLEYRGYDSCGLALQRDGIQMYKDAGRMEKLKQLLPQNDSTIGIGHTRWATHGKPSAINAHPHPDCSGKIAVVHNGVIDNFQKLREMLEAEGHRFTSETDTEVIPHLIEKYYGGNLEGAVRAALNHIEGSYALIVLHSDCPQLVVARQDSPLIVGVGDRENLIASDVPAVLDCTDRVIYLEDGDLGVITGDVAIITSREKGVVRREVHHISWSIEDAEKAGYEYFMLKEIHEQPKAIHNTLRGRISAIEPIVDLGIEGDPMLADILLVACGTSYHAALVGKYVLERLTGIPVRVELASEFNYSHTVIGQTWTIGITQSGETADTLRALKRAKDLGCRTLAVTNVVGSSATRIADESLYIGAGPEISVAATKSFVAQLVALYLLALSRATIDRASKKSFIEGLRLLPNKVQQILDDDSRIAQCGKYLSQYDHAFFIARGLNFPVALEGALKLKEIAYIHAEGYAAGELKHGPLALLTTNTPVIAIATRDNTYETLLANIKEIKAREAPVIALAEEGDEMVGTFVDWVITIPKVNSLFSPVANSVALQLLAYYAAKERGCPVDMPRNLAKSVTVE